MNFAVSTVARLGLITVMLGSRVRELAKVSPRGLQTDVNWEPDTLSIGN